MDLEEPTMVSVENTASYCFRSSITVCSLSEYSMGASLPELRYWLS